MRFNYLNQKVLVKFPLYLKVENKDKYFWGLLDDNIIYLRNEKRTLYFIILDNQLNEVFRGEKTGINWFITNTNGQYFYFERIVNGNTADKYYEYIQCSFSDGELIKKVVHFPEEFKMGKSYSPIYNDNEIIYSSQSLTDEENNFKGQSYLKLNKNGEVIWQSTFLRKGIFGFPEAWNDNYFFFLHIDIDTSEERYIEKESAVVCLSQPDGSMLWRKDIEGIVSGLIATPILLHEGIILVESKKHGIVCIEATTGQILWNWQKSDYLCCRKYTIDYEGILNILEVDIYYQVNLKDGSIINAFDLKKELKRLKIKIGGEYVDKHKNYDLTFSMPSFQPSVSAEHFLIAIFNQVLFVSKSTGKVDYTHLLASKRGKVSELAIIGENRIVLVEHCFSSKMPNTIWKVLESVV